MSQKLVLTAATEKFVAAVEADSPSTAMQYGRRIHNFGVFLGEKYNITIDEYLKSYKDYDVYSVLSAYHVYLKQTRLQRNTISARLRTVKVFLEFHNITIIESQFRIKVRTPRQKKTKHFQALEKKLVNKIIIACQSPRLHTYVLTLAATGMRATECLSILTKHVDFENGIIFLRGEHTKTREARTVYLTKECIAQLKVWKDYRERERRIVGKNGKVVYATKPLKANDLFFSTGRINNADEQDPNYMYHVLSREFSKVLDRIGFSDRNEESKRHEITLHSFRRFVYSTITDLGYHDFANSFIGHAGSTYWRKTDSQKLELFKKIEPYLTYLDYSELEAKGADVQTKLSESQQELLDVKKQLKEMQEQQQEQQKILEEFRPENQKKLLKEIYGYYEKLVTEKDRSLSEAKATAEGETGAKALGDNKGE
jgi:integrase